MAKEVISGKVVIEGMVRLILQTHPEFRDPLKEKNFSDYVVAKIIGDFNTDGGDREKAKNLYISIMAAYWDILKKEPKK